MRPLILDKSDKTRIMFLKKILFNVETHGFFMILIQYGVLLKCLPFYFTTRGVISSEKVFQSKI